MLYAAQDDEGVGGGSFPGGVLFARVQSA
jgi:hypothetical protein